jgi:multidrug resistance efflux pump
MILRAEDQVEIDALQAKVRSSKDLVPKHKLDVALDELKRLKEELERNRALLKDMVPKEAFEKTKAENATVHAEVHRLESLVASGRNSQKFSYMCHVSYL